jgi:LysM repeat protein
MLRVGARSRLLFAAALACVLSSSIMTIGPANAAPSAQSGTSVNISPSQTDLECDETALVEIRINDVSNLYGIDVKIGYDPNVIEIMDADDSDDDVQIQPGDLPDVSNGQGLIQVNAASDGIISYAAVRLGQDMAQDGSGVIASMTIKGIAAGTTDLMFETVLVADETAGPIAADLNSGKVSVTCAGGPNPDPTDIPDPDPTDVPDPDPGSGGHPEPGKPTHPGSGGPQDKVEGCYHYVTPGETLYSIARYNGVSVQALASANGIYDPNYIYVGQKLQIPGCGKAGGGYGKPGPGYGKPGAGGVGCSDYYVSPGDTLYSIAWGYGDSVAGIAKRNGLLNPELIWVGQSLSVCGGGSGGYGKPAPGGHVGKPGGKPGSGGYCSYTHVVGHGETLFGIAWRYNSSTYAISSASGLANPHLIYVGQTLCIP